ncbi:FAD:protein FMN transferase [Lysobacter brunescens]|uniref:FAD:protein FMN transferase n=1 Tax=Lysobacter brunescens TaxID=262323 RepID=A0ABW2YFV1_9GAMM
MGTTWSVRAYCAPTRNPHALHAIAQGALDAVVAQMSPWVEDSDLVRYNRAPPCSVHALPAAFAEVLRCALDIAARSDGAFDPALGALVDAWGFGRSTPAQRVPDDEMLAGLRIRHVDALASLFEDDPPRLRQPGGVTLDFCAIAKGHGADIVARRLRDADVPAALVEVGGELFGYGRKPDGTPWRVVVEGCAEESEPVPDIGPPPLRTVELDGLAIATSGDRWHVFEHDGQRLSHTIDPRTGRPVQDAPVAVTVIADSAMRADAWATALTVMGADAGLAFAERHALAARFLVRDGMRLVERVSSRFDALSEIAG